jgi:hypothetical protein
MAEAVFRGAENPQIDGVKVRVLSPRPLFPYPNIAYIKRDGLLKVGGSRKYSISINISLLVKA